MLAFPGLPTEYVKIKQFLDVHCTPGKATLALNLLQKFYERDNSKVEKLELVTFYGVILLYLLGKIS